MIDILFPPICRICSEPTRRLLCESCFDLLALPDIVSRCRHCFTALESPSGLCSRCMRSPILSSPRAFLFEQSPIAQYLQSILSRDEEAPLQQAIVSLLVVLWSRLNWPLPDRIAIVPTIRRHRALSEIGEEFARQLDQSLSEEFRFSWLAPFRWRLQRRKDDLLENQSVLLIDWASSLDDLKPVLRALWPAFPGKISILTIFGRE